PLLRGLAPHVQGPAGDPADDVEHLIDRDPRTAADVIGPAWHAAVARRRRRRNSVPDKGEVPRLLAIAIEVNGIPRHRSGDEPVEPHVRTLPGPIHREISERR